MSDQTERAAFEAWCKDRGWPHYWHTNGEQFHPDSWVVWQAARAAQPAAEPVAWGEWATQPGKGHRLMMVRPDKESGCRVPLYTHPAPAAEPQKLRPDFTAGYEAGLADGRYVRARDVLTDEQFCAIATEHFPRWREDIQEAFVVELGRHIERNLAHIAAPAAEPLSDALDALRELVALKDLKNLHTAPDGEVCWGYTVQTEYERRKPLAWSAARAVIAAHEAKR